MVIFFIILILVYLGIVLYKANKRTYDVNVNHIEPYTIESNMRGTQLHILHLSDIHLENLSITPEYLYSLVKNEHIDLIALTGDFLDRKRSIPKLIPYLKVFNKLNPNLGIYAVFGNHDYLLREKPFQSLKNILLEYNCKILQNESAMLNYNGNCINIIGVDDFSTKRSDFNKSYKNIAIGYNLVLTHDPNAVLHMKNYHFDYLLSGHFHGGQIHWPKPYHLVKMGKLARLNIIKGLHVHDNKPFYISEGLGQTGVNIRVGSTPEITIHHVDIPKTSENRSIVI